MKIFNYACLNLDCQHTQESWVKDSDQKVPCEKCGSETEKRLTMPAFILKGVGCYSNGTYSKAKEGPYIDPDIYKLSNAELNVECGLPADFD